MKKYTKDDFKTFFARQQAEQAIADINWKILNKYGRTDLGIKLHSAMLKIAQETGQVPLQLPDNHAEILLDNETIIPIEDANAYAESIGKYNYLKTLKIIEDAFESTTNTQTLLKKIMDEEKPKVGELALGTAIKVYPAEASILYFQTRFAEAMKDGHNYIHLNNLIIEQVNMPRGPIPKPLTGEQTIMLIVNKWHNLSQDIEDNELPKLGRLRELDSFKPN